MNNKTHKELLIAAIAEAKGYYYDNGLVEKDTNTVVAVTEHEIAKVLLGQMATESDLSSVDNILKIVSKLPNYEDLIVEAKESLVNAGFDVPGVAMIESNQTGTPGWFRRMMDMFL